MILFAEKKRLAVYDLLEGVPKIMLKRLVLDTFLLLIHGPRKLIRNLLSPQSLR